MATRAKFKVDEIALTTYGTSLRASPVYSSDPKSENKAFWDATPSGKLELNCANAKALAGFKPGDELYIDISLAPKAE